MHILLDARPFFSENFPKEKMYSEDLFQALFRNFPSDIFYIWTVGEKRKKNFFSFSLEQYPNVKHVHTHASESRIDFMMRNFGYPKIDDIAETEAMKKGMLPWIGKFEAAVFFAPYPSPVEDNCLKVCCINDFSELHFPEYFSGDEKSLYSKSAYKKELGSADLILTPSYFVKNDVKKTFGVEEEKIYVMGSGILEVIQASNDDILKTKEERAAEKKLQEEEEKKIENLPEEFFFARGIFSQLNNFDALIKAYTLFCARFGAEKSWKLVIEEEKLNSLNELKSDESPFVIIPPLSDEERIEVLEKAKAFLYPSMYDGVGKPVLEAMRCGCPVASSTFGALPEVYENVAIPFDPTSHLSILRAMKKLFLEKEIREKLSEAGKELSYDSKFLWDDIAERFMHKLQEKREDKDEEIEAEAAA